MALELDAEVGGAAANAYATVDEAIAYAESYGAPGAAFMELDEEQQGAALIFTAMDIDAVRFKGERRASSQSMEHPRVGTGYDSDVIHPNIKRANILEAIARASAFAAGATTDPLNLTASSTNGNVKKKKVGPLETEYFAATTLTTGSLARFTPIVQNLLEPLMYVASGSWGSSAVVTRSS